MKKNLMTLAAVLCCAMVCFFASCQKNGGSSTTPEEQPDNTPAAVEMTFTFWGTQDMLDYADMVVTYNDGTGDKTETVTTVNWVKTIKVALPVTFKFARKVTLKEGVTLNDSQAYSYVKAQQVKYSIQTANGKIINVAETVFIFPDGNEVLFFQLAIAAVNNGPAQIEIL